MRYSQFPECLSFRLLAKAARGAIENRSNPSWHVAGALACVYSVVRSCLSVIGSGIIERLGQAFSQKWHNSSGLDALSIKNVALLCLVLIGGGSEAAVAEDWPQILGPNRNGQSVGAEFATDWPSRFEVKWDAELGSGYGGAAIVGKQVLILHRQDSQEFLESFDLTTGKSRWKCGWPSDYGGGYNSDDGPRCVPTVSRDRAVCYGASGSIACVDIQSGDRIWYRPLRMEFDADDGYFGAGSSPLIMDDVVIVNVGGEKGGVVGLSLDDGGVLWGATDYDASYASPIAIEADSGKLALVVTRLRTVLMDADKGTVLSEIRFGSRGPTVNAATPIPLGNDRYFLTASYGVGATLLERDGGDLIEVYRGSRIMSSQYNTPVLIGDRLIGIDGREDIGVARLKSIDPIEQKELWTEENVGTSHLIARGNQVLMLNVNGQLSLIDGLADTFTELATARLPSGTYRALPALVKNKLIVRNSMASGGSKLLCYEIPTE